MKTFKYSLICEDDAQRYFVETFLGHHFAGKADFVFDELFYKKFKCSNNADVLKSYVIQIERSSNLDLYNLDLVFVGIDYDNRPRESFTAELNKLYGKLNDGAKQKAVVFFPVQAIEHWLIFLQRKAANPSITKTITDDIENTKRADAKRMVYGTKYADKKEIVSNLVKAFDVEWLCTQSVSFRAFYNRVIEVINR